MTDQEMKEKIQRALDRSLAGLEDDPLMAQRVMRQGCRRKGEEQKMKKKLSGGLIFALVLVLLAATALAVTHWEALKGYFETVRTMDTSGELARWSDEDKLRLLEAMAEAALVPADDPRLLAARDESLPLAQRAAAAEELITERYGADYFDSGTVELFELAQVSAAPEDQAAYEQWSQQDWDARAQDAQPIPESATWRATMDNLTEIGEFPQALLRDVRVASEYDPETETWTVTASIDRETYQEAIRGTEQVSLFNLEPYSFRQGNDLCFQFWLDEYGNYLGVNEVGAPENRAALTLEEALPLAKKALNVRLGVTEADLADLTLSSFYSEGSEFDLAEGRFRACCTFSWKQDDTVRYMVDIDAKTGQISQAVDFALSDAMFQQEQQWVAELTEQLHQAGIDTSLYNAGGDYFWQWSVAEKAAWSRQARPIVQEYLAAHPDFAQYLQDVAAGKYVQNDWPILLTITRCAYGTPEEEAVTQEEAFARAKEAALAQGALADYVEANRRHAFYYDVTDPARPLWKVEISQLFGDGDLEHRLDATEPWGFFVVMDARTGEVLRCTPRTVNTSMRDLV